METFWQMEMVDKLIKEDADITIAQYSEIIEEIKNVAKSGYTKELIGLIKELTKK